MSDKEQKVDTTNSNATSSSNDGGVNFIIVERAQTPGPEQASPEILEALRKQEEGYLKVNKPLTKVESYERLRPAHKMKKKYS